jgi:hypothetical protein
MGTPLPDRGDCPGLRQGITTQTEAQFGYSGFIDKLNNLVVPYMMMSIKEPVWFWCVNKNGPLPRLTCFGFLFLHNHFFIVRNTGLHAVAW